MITTNWRVGSRVLGLYEITAVHGEGGMGLVHRVWHTGWRVDLAVKSPRAELFRSRADQERFMREAETWVRLGFHPHVCGCHYVRLLGGVPRVFAEYVDGGSLRAWIDEWRLYRGVPDEVLPRVLDVAIQVAWGLAYAHRRGVVHQDVKPGNVLLGSDGTAKITDFGLARARHFGSAEPPPTGLQAATALLTHGGMTPAYASPEQVGGAPLDERTDEYSFAASVLEMFTGGVNWGLGPAAGGELLVRRFSQPPQGPLPSLPDRIADLLERCLRHDAAERHGSMAEVAERLVDAYEHEVGRPYPRREPLAANLRADGLTNRALSMLDLGLRSEAELTLARAHEADPQHPEASYNLGLLRWRSGSTADDALSAQLGSVHANAADGSTWRSKLLLAQVHLERADPEAALPLLAEARRAAPDDPDVREALRTAQSAVGKSKGFRLAHTLTGHQVGIVAMSLTPDGRHALTSDWHGNVLLWDMESGRCLRKLKKRGVRALGVSLSADGRRAITGDLHGQVVLWDTAGRSRQVIKGHDQAVTAACFSKDGSMAVTGGDDKLYWWETSTGRCLGSIDLSLPDSYGRGRMRVHEVIFVDDGEKVLVVRGSSVALWHLPTGKQLQRLGSLTVWPVTVAPDGSHALTERDDRDLTCWALPAGQARWTRKLVHPRWATAAALAPDGVHGITGAQDGTLLWWNLATGRCLRTVRAHEDRVDNVRISADGRTALTSGQEGNVRVWRLPPPGTYSAPFQICRPRAYKELARYEERFVRLLSEAELARERRHYTEALALVDEARTLPGHERDDRALAAWHRLSLCCVRTGLRGAWPAGTITFREIGEQVEVTADGRRALVADSGGLRLWDLEAGRCLRTFDTEDGGSVKAVALSSDEHRVLSGYENGTLRLWELDSGRCLQVHPGPAYFRELGPLLAVWFSADGLFAFAGGEGKLLARWQLDSGGAPPRYRAYRSATGLVPSADGDFVLPQGTGPGVALRDLVRSVSIREFTEERRRFRWRRTCGTKVRDAQVTADARLVVVTDEAGVRVWDTADGSLRSSVAGTQGEGGQAVSPRTLALSTDSRFAITACSDATIRVLDLHTSRWLRTLEGHLHTARSVRFSADGRYAVSLEGMSGTLRRWELDWELEAREPADWDEAARPHLDAFLATFVSSRPTAGHSNRRTAHGGDFDELLRHLARAGFGWLRPEGVQAELGRASAGQLLE